MRPLLVFSLVLGAVLCLGGAAYAQQQESRIQQILKPDESRGFDLDHAKSFGGAKSFQRKPDKNFSLRSVSTPQKFNAKEFLTGKFHNEKSFWMGDFKYSVSQANTSSPFQFLMPGKKYSTKDVPVKDATGYDKHYNDAATVATRDFRGKERNKLNMHLTPQQAANNGYQGTLTELKTIDDVRTLLNKSK